MSIPENRKAGAAIYDRDGSLICRLARDIAPCEYLRLDQFTDWQIPVPKPQDRIPLAIQHFAGMLG